MGHVGSDDISIAASLTGQAAQAETFLHGRYRNSGTKMEDSTGARASSRDRERDLGDYIRDARITKSEKDRLEERILDLSDTKFYMEANRRPTEPKRWWSKTGESRSKLDSNNELAMAAKDTAKAERERIELRFKVQQPEGYSIQQVVIVGIAVASVTATLTMRERLRQKLGY